MISIYEFEKDKRIFLTPLIHSAWDSEKVESSQTYPGELMEGIKIDYRC